MKRSTAPLQETQYSARVIILVNRTGRKRGKCFEKYSTLPDSLVAVASNLRNFFESLNMFVYYKENVDQTTIREMVSEVIKQSPSYGDHEKIVFYYIGHGEKGELLPYCTCEKCRFEAGIEDARDSDGKPQKIVDLIEMFHNDNTTHLRKLPMLFFFDCCQGENLNEGIEVTSISMGGLPPGVQSGEIIRYVHRIPDAGNILIAHSTLPMLKAYCHPKFGPHWTRILLKNLQIDQSISDALHATQREVSQIDCSIKDHEGEVIMYRTQPSMFYSSLYCEPINFYAMRGKRI